MNSRASYYWGITVGLFATSAADWLVRGSYWVAFGFFAVLFVIAVYVAWCLNAVPTNEVSE